MMMDSPFKTLKLQNLYSKYETGMGVEISIAENKEPYSSAK